MLNLAICVGRAAAQESRSDFKKNFANTLIAKAESYPGMNPGYLSMIKIDTSAEAQEVADIATDSIVANMLRRNQALAPLRTGESMTRQYRMAVNEIIGNGSNIPVGLHCMRSTYENIMLGVGSLGIEEEIIPESAKNACGAFLSEWKARFPQKHYSNLWHENATVYRNHEDYAEDMEKYVAARKPKDKEYAKRLRGQFARNNVHIDELAGSIFLTQRGPGEYHATFYPGKMSKDSLDNYSRSEFGSPIIISFNREYIKEFFGLARKKKISFIANVKAGIKTKVQEGSDEKIRNMKHAEMIEYLSEGAYGAELSKLAHLLNSMPYEALTNLALARYFGKDFEKNLPIYKLINPSIQMMNADKNVRAM
jgi:hypothetical protein